MCQEEFNCVKNRDVLVILSNSYRVQMRGIYLVYVSVKDYKKIIVFTEKINMHVCKVKSLQNVVPQ